MNFDAAALSYVRYVLAEMNLKPGALAQKAGISASTLTRALNDPKHKFKLSMTTLEKIADVSGVNLAPFLEAKTAAQLTLDSAHREDFYKPEANMGAALGREFKSTLIIGDVAAGKWIEPSPFTYFDYGAIFLTSSSHPDPRDCFAYVVRDDSANMFADKGEILFCLKIQEDKVEKLHAEKPNQHLGEGPVIVERRSKDAFRIEVTARLIRRRRDGVPGWELVSARREDHDPNGRPRIPRVFIDKYGGNDEFRIIGEIEYVIRGDTHEALNWLLFDCP